MFHFRLVETNYVIVIARVPGIYGSKQTESEGEIRSPRTRFVYVADVLTKRSNHHQGRTPIVKHWQQILTLSCSKRTLRSMTKKCHFISNILYAESSVLCGPACANLFAKLSK